MNTQGTMSSLHSPPTCEREVHGSEVDLVDDTCSGFMTEAVSIVISRCNISAKRVRYRCASTDATPIHCGRG